MLGGQLGARLPVALDLVRRRRGTGARDLGGRHRWRAGADSAAERELEGARSICRRAEPYSTRGESRQIVAALADERGWDRIIVVTSRYHLLRAERLIGRCTDAELVMRGAEPEPLDTDLRSRSRVEWAKLGLAETLRRGC